MRISTKGTYALEVIVDLAMHSSKDHLEQLKQIAKRRNLSEKYLERIVKAMKNAGLIQSTRGSMGGVLPCKVSGGNYGFRSAEICGRRIGTSRMLDRREKLWKFL